MVSEKGQWEMLGKNAKCPVSLNKFGLLYRTVKCTTVGVRLLRADDHDPLRGKYVPGLYLPQKDLMTRLVPGRAL